MNNNIQNTNENQGIVTIHGKEYVTVAKRVKDAHEANEKLLSITTELVSNDPILFKATVITNKGTFTGYSAAYGDPRKPIEKQSPYEVAETSAVGRALGFASYGSIDSIASADEMVKAQVESSNPNQNFQEENSIDDLAKCMIHDKMMKAREGQYGVFHSHSRQKENGEWEYCKGSGYPIEQRG